MQIGYSGVSSMPSFLSTANIGANGLAVDTASIVFDNIPNTYRHLELVISGRITEAVTDDFPTIRFNNDSAANYDSSWTFLRANAAAGGTAQAGRVAGVLCDLPGGGANNAAYAGGSKILIPNYANTSFHKTASSFGGLIYDVSGSPLGLFCFEAFTNWRNTAAISRIDIIAPASSLFKAGSMFSLYGLN